jgi:hypothetical protein
MKPQLGGREVVAYPGLIGIDLEARITGMATELSADLVGCCLHLCGERELVPANVDAGSSSIDPLGGALVALELLQQELT